MNFSRKKLLISGVMLLLVMVLIAGCAFNERNIGVIDMNKVIKESPRAQQYQNQLDERGAEIQEEYKAIADDKNLSEEEKEKKQEVVLQKFVDAKKDLEDKLNKDVEEAVTAVAKEKKLDIIFYKQSVRYGGIDITEEVINSLK